jgi:hypothetical protein
MACQADPNGVFEDDRHLEGLPENLRSGDPGQGREAIRATIANTMLDEDGTLTLTVKPEGLFRTQTAIAHSGCRGSGPHDVRMGQSGQKYWTGMGSVCCVYSRLAEVPGRPIQGRAEFLRTTTIDSL